MAEHRINRRELTFSQAAGIDPLPQPAKLGELPWKARNSLWSVIFESIRQTMDYYAGREILGEPWRAIFYGFHVSILDKPSDEFDSHLRVQLPLVKDLVLDGSYNRVFDLLQYIMRHESAPQGFRDFLVTTLQKCLCAYSVIEGECTIVPSAIPEQRTSVAHAFSTLVDGPFGGARQHLLQSAERINSADYSGSVRESIHAVESVARRLDGNAGKSLSSALVSLSKRGLALHGAFKSGIEKLYGYTSDEDGIRHSLSDVTTNVDAADAVFMFGACASFAAFLVEKARAAGIQIEE